MPLCRTTAAATAETLLAELSTRIPAASIRGSSAIDRLGVAQIVVEIDDVEADVRSPLR